jgi:hypothetical protein
MYIDIDVKYLLFLSNFNDAASFLPDFQKKYSNIKFHENPSNGSQVVSWGQTDMMVTVAFHSFENVPKNTQRILVGKTFRR